MLLADQITRSILHPPQWCERTTSGPDRVKRTHELRTALGQAHIITMDAATEFFFAVSPQEEWTYSRDFPQIRLPSQRLWVETGRPSRIHSSVHGTLPADTLPFRWGVLFDAQRMDVNAELMRKDPEFRAARISELERQVDAAEQHYGTSIDAKIAEHGPAAWKHFTEAERYYAALGSVLEMFHQGRDPAEEGLVDSAVSWVVQAVGFLEMPAGRIVGPVVQWMYTLDSEWKHLCVPVFGAPVPAGTPLPKLDVGVFNPLIFPALVGLTALAHEGAVLVPVPGRDGLRSHDRLEFTGEAP